MENMSRRSKETSTNQITTTLSSSSSTASSRSALDQKHTRMLRDHQEIEPADPSSTPARFNRIAPIQVEENHPQLKTRAGKFCNQLFQGLFILHLVLTFVLTIILTINGLKSSHTKTIHPIYWYPPLLTSIFSSTIIAFAWILLTTHNPTLSIKAAFWLAPSLTFAASLLLLSTTTDAGLVVGALGIVFSLAQSLYACWVSPHQDHAARILSLSLSTGSNTIRTIKYTTLALLSAAIYSALWISGIGNAISFRFFAIFITALLLSLAWTMHVTRNILHVAFALIAYKRVVRAEGIDMHVAVKVVLTEEFGTVCQGSVLVPMIRLERGLACSVKVCAGETDEFVMSCTNCCVGISERVVEYGNRWGWVHVGVYGKGIVQGSRDTWEMFRRVGMVGLIDSDLTEPMCFLCGVVGDSVGAIVGGSWAFIVYKGYAISIPICGFLLGYFTIRIAISWPQACVSAYYVAYAENPQSHLFGSTITDRIRALQTCPA